MSTLPIELPAPRAESVRVTRDSLVVDLVDGRSIVVPVSWYPRLHHGTVSERGHWRLVAGGEGIHWPELDEDISVEGLLAGHPSGESQSSFQRWLNSRGKKRANKRLHPTAAANRSKRKRTSSGGRRG